MDVPGRFTRWNGNQQPPPLHGVPGTGAGSRQTTLFRDLTILLGLLVVLSAFLGLTGMRFGLTILSSVYPGYKTIALSAALIWILAGSLLALNALKPLRGGAAKAAQVVLGAVILLEALELPLSITGSHSGIETWLTGIGAILLGSPASPISPVASALIVAAAVSLLLILQDPDQVPQNRRIRDAAGMGGLIIAIVSFTFVLSYLFGDPLLYGTQFIPIAAISAIAALFCGTGLVTAAGPAAVPLRYVTGDTIRAGMLRIFVPLAVAIILVQQIVFFFISSHHIADDAIVLAGSLVLFALITGYVVSRISGTVGSALDRAEAALVNKNEDLCAMNEELGAMNEELMAMEEELRQNIEELGKSETTLRESLFFTRNILNNLFSFVGVMTPDGVLVEVNRAPLEAAGITAEECLNRFFWDCYWWCHDAEAQAKIHASCEKAARGEISRFDIQAQMAGGSLVWIDYQIAPLRDSTGKITHLIPSAIDITERRQGEEALRLSEQGLARSQMIAHLGSWDLDLVHNRLSWSDEVYRIFGLRPQEFHATYEAFLDAVHPEDRAAVDAAYSRSIREGKDSYTIDHRVIQKDTREIRYVHEKCEHLRDETGRIIRSVGMVHDITERKQVEEALQQNLQKLSRREQELGEALAEKEVLLSEIHHRVKNNLSAFISLLSLEGSYDDSPAGIVLKKDLQNRARSMALIHETLYRTRKYSTVDMDLYLKTLVGQITGTYALPGELRVQVETGGIVLDLSRATTCGLIVNELVTNSFKYAFSAPFDCRCRRGKPCTIAVTLAEEAGYYVLRAGDNGIGLPAGFEIRTAKSLGLKLVNFLAGHQLRATVSVRSEEGTEFELRFPVNQQHRSEA